MWKLFPMYNIHHYVNNIINISHPTWTHNYSSIPRNNNCMALYTYHRIYVYIIKHFQLCNPLVNLIWTIQPKCIQHLTNINHIEVYLPCNWEANCWLNESSQVIWAQYHLSLRLHIQPKTTQQIFPINPTTLCLIHIKTWLISLFLSRFCFCFCFTYGMMRVYSGTLHEV